MKKGFLQTALAVAAGVLFSAGNLGAADAGLPFAEDFSRPLGSGWKTVLADGDAATVSDGSLEIRATPGHRACIDRALDADLVRISCALKSESSAAPALLALRWEIVNYLQFGLNEPENGSLNTREVTGTYPEDAVVGAAPAGEWHFIAIELARDCIRYLGSRDGRRYETLQISPRPARFAGAPKVLSIGPDCGGKMFPRPTPWLTPPAAQNPKSIRVRDLRIESLPKSRIQASPAERKQMAVQMRDAAGDRELAGKNDPTFESVSRYFPPLKWPREAVGVKDHPFTIGVAADASLQLNDNIATFYGLTAHFEIDGHRFGSGRSACAKSLHEGWMPMVTSRDKHAGWELEQTTFGWSAGFSPDEPLSGFVQFRAVNPGAATRSMKLQFVVQPTTNGVAPLSWSCEVPAGSSKTVCVRVPYEILKSPAVEIGADEFKTKLAATAGYWNELVGKGSRFELPEPRVQDAYRAWIAYSFLNVGKRDGVFHVCDGSGFYNRVYGYSAALYFHLMDLLGYHDQAVIYCDSLLTFMQTNGLLAVNFGDTDTGTALWCMSEHYRITRDAGWLRRVAPKMIKMCDWIITQRQATLAGTNEPALTRGLIRYRPYADLLHPAADYFSNGYLWKGLDATARVFAEVGLTAEAARLQAAAEAYLRDIRASMDAAVFTDRDLSILPAIPDTRELWKESNGSADGYYGIIAPCLLEAGVPAWDDPKAKLIVDALEQRGGLVAGVSRFHSMADHAYAYGYWINRLQHDDVKRAILGLYGSMAYGMSRDTYSAVECTMVRTGENYWTLPHTYSDTQQLRLLRHMLVREDGEKLWLGQAIPRPWLERGKRVAVKDTPTTFGPVSYGITAREDGSMSIDLTPPARTAPAEILLRLRHPQQRNIAQATLAGAGRCRSEGDMLHLTEVHGPIRLHVTFK